MRKLSDFVLKRNIYMISLIVLGFCVKACFIN